MYYITHDPKPYGTLESAKAALLRQINDNRETAVLMGRASTWEVPNWAISDTQNPAFGEYVLHASELWESRAEAHP